MPSTSSTLGRRLENLSWRLWQKETFIVNNEEKTPPATQILPQTFHSESKISDVPALSSSVETLVDEEAVDSTSVSVPLGIDRPHIRRQDSCASARSKSGRHISSENFKKMMISIIKDNGPLPASRYGAPVAKEPLPVPKTLERSGSNTAESQSPAKSITASESSPKPPPQSLPRTTVVRGFRPSQIPTPQTIPGAAPSSDDIQEPQSSPVSSEQDQSLRNNKSIDDDDDSSDWEDSVEESGNFFQRLDVKPNLTSRRSLITLMLVQNDRARTLGNHASQSTSAIPRSRMAHGPSLSASPNDSDEAPLMMKGMRGPGLEPIHQVPRSSAQPIMTGSNRIQPQAALIPLTTRHSMQRSEPLRLHLVREHQQNSLTDNDDRNGEDSSHDVANRKQDPKKPYMKKSEDVNASNWNQYFSKEASNGYHSKGW
ncbi:hypothetical protein FAGAP_7510 [Fusarium agapanthi]|uniref:Nitrogen regulatory protein areA GATA-like domain-containing protein n=1 Tax=Fusarium agapanthi TaxID=1803897 RepID=A0A9P5E5N3_9HYPO|nr:hypothetical protein FAGAP_7510 [Fusarium agapanthi]